MIKERKSRMALSAFFAAQTNTTKTKEFNKISGVFWAIILLVFGVSLIFSTAILPQSILAEASVVEATVIFNGTSSNYDSLTDAWTYANSLASSESLRATVKLNQNITISGSLVLTTGKYITLDLYGQTLSRGLTSATANGSVIINRGDLIVEDTSAYGNGIITGGHNSNNPTSSFIGGGIVCETSSKLVMKGGSISGNKSLYGGGVGLKGGAAFVLEGGKITNNEIYSQGSGGGIYVQDSTLEIKGGEISNNTAKTGGGGFILIRSTGLISGGKILNNYTEGTYGGGGIYINSSSFKMTGGEITLNSSISNGGGIYQYWQSPIQETVLLGGTITNNTCASGKNGGGIFVSGNFYVAGDVNVTGNVSGGAIASGTLTGGSPNNINLRDDGTVLVNAGYLDGDRNYDFGGEVGIYSKNYTRNTIFGTIVNNADISDGKFYNDRNEYLFGQPKGTDLEWEYEFNDAVVITNPTSTTNGLARQTAIGAPSVTRDITLNHLNTTDYDVINDSFEDDNPTVTYTLKDTSNGVIAIDYSLPNISDSGYLWDIITAPTLSSQGEVSATHSSYPGLTIDGISLPALNDTDYTLSYTPPTITESGKLTYKYKEIGSDSVMFEVVLIDIGSIAEAYYDIDFFGESGFQYAVLKSTDSPESNTVWIDGEDDILTFSADDGTDYKIYAKPIYSGGVSDSGYYAASVSTPANVNAASVTLNGVTEYYMNFKDAWDAAMAASTTSESKAVVTLYKDVLVIDGDFGTIGTPYLTVNQDDHITLDLNGHTIDRGLDSPITDGYVIKVEGEFTIQDSSASGNGTITGGYNIDNGGGIYVGAGGEFTLSGGSISNNISQSNGGGVYISDTGEFTISGGSVSNNTSGESGGIYVGGTLNVSGNAEVTGNQTDGGESSNIYLAAGQKVNIAGGDFTGTIGLSAENQGIVIEGWTESVSGSVSLDNDGLVLIKIGDKYALYIKLQITYQGGDNTGGNVPIDGNEYYEGKSVTVLGNTGNLTKIGYTFVCWSDGDETYMEGSVLVFVDSDIILTAIWSINAPSVNESAAHSATYDGASHNISVAAEHDLSDTYTIGYRWYKNSVSQENLIDGAVSSTFSVKDVADSATYYCVVTITDGVVSSSTISGGISVNIMPKSVIVDWDSEDGFTWEYTGNSIVPSATVNTGIDGETLTLTISGQAVNANDSPYSAVASASDSNYTLTNVTRQFNIVKANYDMSGVAFVGGSYIYNGLTQALVISGALPIGNDSIALEVSYSVGAKNVADGDVTMTATFSTDSTNYFAPVAMTAVIKILPKAITVTATPLTIKQGDTDANLIYTADALFDGDSFTGSLTRQSGSTAGKYTILQGTLSAGTNYELTFLTAVYTILATSLQSGNVDAKIEIIEGVDPDSIFWVAEISESEADDRLSISNGRELVGFYNAKLSVGDVNITIGNTVTVTLNVVGIEDGTVCEIIIIEDGLAVKKLVIVDDGKVTFETSELGDFILAKLDLIQLAKEETEDELNSYVTNPSEAVQEIIDNAVSGVDGSNYTDIADIIADAKTEIDIQLAKEEALKELEDFFNTLKDTNDYTEENHSNMDEIYADGIIEINDSATIAAINEALKNTKEQLESISPNREVINLWWVIILLSIIIFIECLVIVYLKKRKRKQQRTYSLSLLSAAVIIPNHAILVIIILAIIVVILAAYIIYLLLRLNIKRNDTVIENKSENSIENNVIINANDENMNNVDEIDKGEDSNKENDNAIAIIDVNIDDEILNDNNIVDINTAQDRSKATTIYNYSFTARLHLNDPKTDERYNAIKNCLFSYQGVSNNIAWKQETFTAKGKMVAKIKINGATIRVHLGVNPKDYVETNNRLIDDTAIASHKTTPALKIVKGPRQLLQALELIGIWMKDAGIQKNTEYTNQDYTINKMTKEQLIEVGLIKIQNAEFIDKHNKDI